MITGEFIRDGSDHAPRPQFVMEVDPTRIDDLLEQKAVLAMRAMRQSVDGDPDYEATNAQLLRAAAAVNRPPTVTYEDMIFSNPILDRGAYVMSRESDIAGVEQFFYASHRLIEQQTYAAIAGLVGREVYEATTSDPRNPHAVQIDFDALRAPEEHLDEVHRRTIELYRGMTADQFTALRTVFGGLNGHEGPSGLHSASIPLLDYLIHGGGNISEGDRDRMTQVADANLHPAGQPFDLLLQAALAGHSVELALDPEHRQLLIDKLNRFRQIHRGSVKKFLPEVDAGNAAGTGGVATVGSYLASKMVARPGVDA